MMDLNQHIVKNENDNPLHSNGIARIDDSGRIGSVSNESFTQRMAIDGSRSLIGKYRGSFLGSQRGQMTIKKYVRPQPKIPAVRGVDSKLQQYNSTHTTVPKRSFTEPQSRNYNPYN